MLRTILLLISVLIATSSFAINPVKDKTKNKNEAILSEGVSEIDAQLEDLMKLERVVAESQLDYNEIQSLHPELIASTNVSATANEGLLDGAADVPLGIPGFWWGFCLGVTGMLVVYLIMDDGSDRKEQVKNALYGCVISTAVGVLIWVVALASTT